MLRLIRDDFDTYPTIGEMNDGDSAGFMDDRLRFLVICEVMGDCYMAVAFDVDTFHFLTEEPAMGRGVAELVDSDVIMDHLMEDGIFDEGFREVNAGVDTKDKILVIVTAEKSLFTAGKGDLPEESFSMGELDWDRRKRTAKIAGIELVKAGLDVRNRWFHL